MYCSVQWGLRANVIEIIRVKFPRNCLEARLSVNWTTSGQTDDRSKAQKMLSAPSWSSRKEGNAQRKTLSKCAEFMWKFFALCWYTPQSSQEAKRVRLVLSMGLTFRKLRANFRNVNNFCFQFFHLPTEDEYRAIEKKNRESFYLLRWRHLSEQTTTDWLWLDINNVFRQRQPRDERQQNGKSEHVGTEAKKK